MEENTNGIFHHVDASQQHKIVTELGSHYVDLYDAIECVRSEIRALEEELDRIFFGKKDSKKHQCEKFPYILK